MHRIGCHTIDVWFESEELSDTTKTNEKSTDLLPMPPLESDEEEGKALKILTNYLLDFQYC